MILSIVLLLFTLIVVRKNPSKWKRVVFRMIALACIIYCLAVGFYGLVNMLLTDQERANLNSVNAAYDTLPILNREEGRDLLIKNAAGLLITIFSILLFRKFRQAKSLFPVCFAALVVGLGLAVLDIVAGFGIHRAVYYVAAAILIILLKVNLKRYSRPGYTSIGTELLVSALCISLMLSIGNITNQMYIAHQVELAEQQRWEQRVRMEREIRTTLKHPDQATIKFNSNGTGTVTAPNDFGVNVTQTFTFKNGQWVYLDP